MKRRAIILLFEMLLVGNALGADFNFGVSGSIPETALDLKLIGIRGSDITGDRKGASPVGYFDVCLAGTSVLYDEYNDHLNGSIESFFGAGYILAVAPFYVRNPPKGFSFALIPLLLLNGKMGHFLNESRTMSVFCANEIRPFFGKTFWAREKARIGFGCGSVYSFGVSAYISKDTNEGSTVKLGAELEAGGLYSGRK